MRHTQIGLIGLGTMGAMLALNIAEKGSDISVFNRTVTKVDEFFQSAGDLAQKITPTHSLEEFVQSIAPPRAIILMVPAGEAVDQQIEALLPLLGKDDLIIDAGNANFHDTNRRAKQLKTRGMPYLGIGVSGGEEGARFGPSIMGGGEQAYWDRVAPILQGISAKYEGEACATLMGEGGAGHFVKTVHNGIEYADMQLIAEIYGILRDGLGYSPTQIGEVFESWNQGLLKSYLIEISAKVCQAVDAQTNTPLIDLILDKAGQKGTGRWTVIESQHVGTSISVIEAAVAARVMSANLETRKKGQEIFGAAPVKLGATDLSIDQLESALIVGKLICYAQGFELMTAAGDMYGWDLPMPDIAKVWREGCIIRSTMLNDMASALDEAPARNLLFAPYFAELAKSHQQGLRHIVATGVTHGLGVTALGSALGYFDGVRTARSTANLIQGQRDFFGAHSFERLDMSGTHHGPWKMKIG